ncbi:MAG TPA: hypothetical protein DHW82_10940 [Spirochaetia bacterium]|nr:MAG: hypothetical protein A2Y41_10855 [Spirochaetes bacterium GWB1_36_13]HCL57509.1 hypothetical protein [Spirochaetia bacterium]
MNQRIYTIVLILAVFFSFSLTNTAESKKGKKLNTGLEETNPNLKKTFRTSTPMKASGLPDKADLSANLPKPGNQGYQGSCVAWATTYAYKSYHEKVERKWDIDTEKHLFSPAFVYNQIQLPGGGSYFHEALDVLKNQGAATLSTMSYNPNIERDNTQPSAKARQEASQYKAKDWKQLRSSDSEAIKKELAGENPVVFGLNLKESFYNYSGGVYKTQSGGYLGGHAMLLVGYDDSKKAYKVMNSWGTNWGEKGFLWLDYSLFEKDCNAVYVMYDDIANQPEEKKAEIPQNVSASQGTYTDQIRIMWAKVENIDSYIIYRADAESDNFKKISDSADNEYIDTEIKSGKSYRYAVKAVNRSGESDYSDIAEGFLKEESKKSDNLGQPQNLSASYDSGKVVLSWNLVDGADNYSVMKFDENAKDYEKIGSSKSSTFTDSKVKSGENYWYVVFAVSGKKISPTSDGVSVDIPESKKEVLPETPKDFEVSQGDFTDKVEIKWASAPNAESYWVLKWNADAQVWEELVNTKQNTFTDKNVIPDTSYYYILCSANIAGFSEYTDYKNGNASSMASDTKKSKSQKVSENSYKEGATDYVSSDFKSKGTYKKIIPFKDSKGKKIKDEFYLAEEAIQNTGYYKTIVYYNTDGGVTQAERYYTDGFAKKEGYNIRITYYAGSFDKKLKLETLYSDEFADKKGYYKRMTFYRDNEVYKVESVYTNKVLKSKGYYRIVIFVTPDLKPIRKEYFDYRDIKIKEESK